MTMEIILFLSLSYLELKVLSTSVITYLPVGFFVQKKEARIVSYFMGL